MLTGGEEMDQQKIGKFISEQRKQKALTQSQLAAKLQISEKTVSKWECGKGLPEVSLMVPLCEILGISVNELLSGEKIEQERYKEKAEEKLIEGIAKEKFESKKKLVASCMIGIFCTIILCMAVALAGIVEQLYIRIILIAFAIVLFAIGVAMACILDIEVGYFECPHCHNRYTPTFKAYVLGMHTITMRHLKCPKCKKWGWHKHRIKKSD